MPFLLLMLLALASLQSRWPAPPDWLGWWHGVLATWLGMALIIAWNALTIQRMRERLQADPASRGDVFRHYSRQRRAFVLVLLGFFLGALYLLGWGHTLRNGWNEWLNGVPGIELVLLAPFFVPMAAAWVAAYSLEKTAHAMLMHAATPFPSRRAYLALQARQNLLLIVPPVFLMLLLEGMFYFVPELRLQDQLLTFFGLGTVAFALLTIPWLLRFFLGLRPLEAGPLRDRLAACAHRLGFRYSEVYVWDTRGNIANAMVTGVLPWFRYVVLTDHLIRGMSEDEIEAVFGHEVGHLKHHHLAFYLIFVLGSLVAMGAVWDAGQAFMQRPETRDLLSHGPWGSASWEVLRMIATLPLLIVAAFYFFVVFGFLSRRCERQADLFGCRTASTAAMIGALEKVADLNGISRDNPGLLSSWQHSTIAQRVAFLQELNADPALEPRFHRRVGMLKWSVALLAGVVLWVWGPANLIVPPP